MIDSKLTHVKVNAKRKALSTFDAMSAKADMGCNKEIELCEVYDKETKELVKKAFFGAGVSFFIKIRKAVSGKEGRFIICVNSDQKNVAKTAILRKVAKAKERVNFFDNSYFMEGGAASFKGGVVTESTCS